MYAGSHWAGGLSRLRLVCAQLPIFLFFFFQAEDGIRDLIVTGVQTCALPISQQSRYTPQGHQERPSHLPESIAPELLVRTTVAYLQNDGEQTFHQQDNVAEPPAPESTHDGDVIAPDATQRHFCHYANCLKSYARYG